MLMMHAFCFMTFVTLALTQDCGPGWFGSECLYKSHCPNSDCDLDANCPRDARCQEGWFGPGCQYVDLVASSKSITTDPATSQWRLLDRSDQTCSPIEKVTVEWERPHFVTWMRVYLPPSELLPDLKISITDAKGKSHDLVCKNGRVSNWTLDIQCDLTLVAVQQLQISALAGLQLCSLYISGGRNVALRQATWQSTTLNYKAIDLESRLAVDGSTKSDSRSCTTTKHGDQDPTWELRFKSPKILYHFKMLNRNTPDLHHRLKGFTLTCLEPDGNVAFTHTDTLDKAQAVYNVTVDSHIPPVSLVRVQASLQNSPSNKSDLILALCEVEVIGDSDCYPGTYGLECEHACNCKVKGEVCFFNTGTCPSGCVDQLRNGSCLDEAAPSSALTLFVGVGVALTVVVVSLVALLVWFCYRRFTRKGPQEYDMPGPSHEYNQDYRGLCGAGPANLEINSVCHRSALATQESGIYERINSNEYAELQDYPVT